MSGGDSSQLHRRNDRYSWQFPQYVIHHLLTWEIASVSEGGKVFVDPDAQSLEPLLDKPSRAAITSFLQLGSRHAWLPCLHGVDPILLSWTNVTHLMRLTSMSSICKDILNGVNYILGGQGERLSICRASKHVCFPIIVDLGR